jgi:hypothetical protein
VQTTCSEVGAPHPEIPATIITIKNKKIKSLRSTNKEPLVVIFSAFLIGGLTQYFHKLYN